MAVSGADIVAFAQQQIGKPYEWAAEGPNKFDCSGLVQYVYKHFGLSVPRTTYQQVADKNLQTVQRKDLSPGDLIFSHWEGEGPNSHVAIYAGNGQVIEAANEQIDVTATKLGDGYWSHVDSIRRVPGTDKSGGSSPNILGAILTGAQAAGGPVGALAGFIPDPGDIVQAVGNIGAGVASVAQSAAQVGTLAEGVGKLLLPSNAIRAAALFAGTAFLFIGIWFLAREIKSSGA